MEYDIYLCIIITFSNQKQYQFLWLKSSEILFFSVKSLLPISVQMIKFALDLIKFGLAKVTMQPPSHKNSFKNSK